MLLADWKNGTLTPAAKPEEDAVIQFLTDKNIAYTTWGGWHKLDAAERALGEAEGRERKKIVEWNDMVTHAHHKNED